MRGRWREGRDGGSSRLWVEVALAVGLLLLAGCGGGEEVEEAEGEGLEPRIVTEGPVDAPGRPGGRERGAAFDLEEEEAEGARWVPHLTVGDLGASVEFYRGIGFATAPGEGEEGRRVELEREGVRLVLVAAAEAADGAAPAAEAGAAAETPAGTAGASPVLHLVGEGGDTGREVRDPDGHRLVIAGGG